MFAPRRFSTTVAFDWCLTAWIICSHARCSTPTATSRSGAFIAVGPRAISQSLKDSLVTTANSTSTSRIRFTSASKWEVSGYLGDFAQRTLIASFVTSSARLRISQTYRSAESSRTPLTKPNGRLNVFAAHSTKHSMLCVRPEPETPNNQKTLLPVLK